MKSLFLAAARRWVAEDPEPETRRLLTAAIEANDEAELERGFASPLGFGTAGLRGPVGFGPARMNLAVVLQVSHALSVFLKEAKLHERPLLIGFDGRPESAGFARAAASVHAAAGLEVLLFDRAGPTPWVSFGARWLKAAAGVVLTPSHNPRGDAGYKLFDDVGIQIVSPWDTRIAELMRTAPPANEIERDEARVRPVPPELLEAYDAWLGSLATTVRGESNQTAESRNEVSSPVRRGRVGYTPLHGVGWAAVEEATRRFPIELVAVPEQKEIDGNFPTTPFPNPEEPGVLDALQRVLAETSSDLGLANDPDADRFALVAPRLGALDAPRPLSGDALGLLLADIWLEANAHVESALVVSTVVSSPGLEKLTQLRGARVERTLTGFKWLCRPALSDARFVFAYEEALGYCFARERQQPVLDKDGLAALSVLLAFVERQRASSPDLSPGECVARRLAHIARGIGLWVSVGHGVRFDSVERAATIVNTLRRNAPAALGGRRVLDVVDYAEGAESRPFYRGAQNLLVFEVEGGFRLCVRPSGTEPKLKLYVHVVREFGADEEYASLEAQLTSDALGWAREVERQLLG